MFLGPNSFGYQVLGLNSTRKPEISKMPDGHTFQNFRYGSNVEVKLSLLLNQAPCHEGVLGDWRYSSTHF
jgi:hypothetical protein